MNFSYLFGNVPFGNGQSVNLSYGVRPNEFRYEAVNVLKKNREEVTNILPLK